MEKEMLFFNSHILGTVGASPTVFRLKKKTYTGLVNWKNK
jgi:hypothetical protein